MGVPAFFRWIQEKYPKIVKRAIEEFPKEAGMKVDATKPNPNNYEWDNLYLDMNGLIHPCTHPEGEEAPPTEEEMYLVIFDYLDRLLNLIRPRKLIYMAIDGVAPRAKMNQQRSRRFRSAQEAEEASEDADRIRREMISMGMKPPPKRPPQWDSNVITPGTEFMATLSDWLRYYIAERINRNPAFKNVRVILSDAQSPGEGEHKIMQFIRRQRAEPGYDPNTTHCLYGLDADLIMLGLASHEVHFTILREEVIFDKRKKQASQGFQVDPVLLKNDGSSEAQEEATTDDLLASGLIGTKKKPFDIVQLWILREYLQCEFRADSFYQPLPFEYNFEACIDDFVFLCFFVGNDFLPHLPSLSIREGGLELLIDLYRRVLPTVGGYLTTEGVVNLKRVDVYMGVLGTVEDEIFRRRREAELRDQQRRENNKRIKQEGGIVRAQGAAAKADAQMPQVTKKRKSSVRDRDDFDMGDMIALGRGRTKADLQKEPLSKLKPKKKASDPTPTKPPDEEANKNAAAALREQLSGSKRPAENSNEDGAPDEEEEEEFGEEENGKKKKKKMKQEVPTGTALVRDSKIEREKDSVDQINIENYIADDSASAQKDFERRVKEKEKSRNIVDDVVDDVRLGEVGWKDRYYVSKFGEEYRNPHSTQRKDVVKSYVTGLCWVMEYYYRGCQSWTWFYEYHYAPFASDLVNIDDLDIKFPPSLPFKPIEQLMGVFPPASAHALPDACRWFMTNIDSPIIDFYPKTFKYDPNGKTARWLWVALLPFIDENRLLKVTRSIENEFSDRDKERNKCNPDLVFAHSEAPGTDQMAKVAKEFQQRVGVNHFEQQNSVEEGAFESTPTTAGDVRVGSKDCGRLLLSPDTNGIAGYFLPPPAKFEMAIHKELLPPSKRVDPINDNKVCCFEFRLPKMRPHLSKINDGTHIPPPILTREDLNIKPPKLGRGANIGSILMEQHGAQAHRSMMNGPPGHYAAHNLSQNFSNSGLLRQQQHWGTNEPRGKRPMPPNRQYHQQQHYQQQQYGYNNRGGYGNNDPRYRNDPRQQQQQQQQYQSYDNRYQNYNRQGNSSNNNNNPFVGGSSSSGGRSSSYQYNQRAPPPGNTNPGSGKNALMNQLSIALQRRQNNNGNNNNNHYSRR